MKRNLNLQSEYCLKEYIRMNGGKYLEKNADDFFSGSSMPSNHTSNTEQYSDSITDEQD